MNISSKHSLTLVELLLASALVGFLLLGITYFETFARDHLTVLDRRIRVQNEVSRTLEHMSKNLSRGIGDVSRFPVFIWNDTPGASATSFGAFVDTNQNSRRDDPSIDLAQFYMWTSNQAIFPNYEYVIMYLDGCEPGLECLSICLGAVGNCEVIARRIFNFNVAPIDNCIEIQITGRWDPTQSVSLGNPEVTMQARIKMPSVSTN